jgi:hypothetical protein
MQAVAQAVRAACSVAARKKLPELQKRRKRPLLFQIGSLTEPQVPTLPQVCFACQSAIQIFDELSTTKNVSKGAPATVSLVYSKAIASFVHPKALRRH